MKSYLVTVIVPIYNEEKYIIDFLESLEKQDYSKGDMEVFLIDGNSTDKTVKLINDFISITPLPIKLLHNPKRSQASAMNLGLSQAQGTYLVRLDAHAEYPQNYISTAIRLLEETGADNVGFCIETRGKSPKGKLFAKVLSSKFGVGNSSFRTKERLTEADTVPFGAFKASTLFLLGGFDERLLSNEDNDINYRIIRNGGRILLSNDCEAIYYTRDRLRDLLKMALRNGCWNVKVLFYRKGAMRLRHFVPLLFLISLISFSLLSVVWPAFLAVLTLEILSYIFLAAYFAHQQSSNSLELFQIMVVFLVFHVTYGLGSIQGIFEYFKLVTRSFLKE